MGKIIASHIISQFPDGVEFPFDLYYFFGLDYYLGMMQFKEQVMKDESGAILFASRHLNGIEASWIGTQPNSYDGVNNHREVELLGFKELLPYLYTVKGPIKIVDDILDTGDTFFEFLKIAYMADIEQAFSGQEQTRMLELYQKSVIGPEREELEDKIRAQLDNIGIKGIASRLVFYAYIGKLDDKESGKKKGFTLLKEMKANVHVYRSVNFHIWAVQPHEYSQWPGDPELSPEKNLELIKLCIEQRGALAAAMFYGDKPNSTPYTLEQLTGPRGDHESMILAALNFARTIEEQGIFPKLILSVSPEKTDTLFWSSSLIAHEYFRVRAEQFAYKSASSPKEVQIRKISHNLAVSHSLQGNPNLPTKLRYGILGGADWVEQAMQGENQVLIMGNKISRYDPAVQRAETILKEIGLKPLVASFMSDHGKGVDVYHYNIDGNLLVPNQR